MTNAKPYGQLKYTEVSVPGVHFIQEDSPDEIGTAVADFVRGLRRGG